MPEEIEKFDPSTLMQGVKDRIKATFVSLIPDDQWDAMMQKEINAFFEPQQFSRKWKDEYDGWKHKYTLESDGTESPFRALIWDKCFEKCMEKIDQIITKDWFGNQWPITDENMNENLKKAIVEAAPIAMLKFFEGISINATNQLRNDLRNNRV